VWTPAYDAHDEIRDGAWVAELTGQLDLTRWPAGMRVIVRKERPHPGAQLRITDVDGMRITAFATNTTRERKQSTISLERACLWRLARPCSSTPHGTCWA